jgi:hypothetical protein
MPTSSNPADSGQSEHPLRIPGKTVYVLGTGFSKPLGLPVISEFIPEGLRILKADAAKPKTQEADRTACTKAIQGIQGPWREWPWLRMVEGKHTEPTIEDLFSALDLYANRYGLTWGKPELLPYAQSEIEKS